MNRQWLHYAAGLLIFAGLGLWLSQQNKVGDQNAAAYIVSKSSPIVPGSNKAVLTLADGKSVTLNGKSAGVIASQGGIVIVKDSSGTIQYKAGPTTPQTAYNTLTIPRGGTYSIKLTDGTKVWLNSSSSMKYPTVFAGPVREVQITGEAYFEVAKNSAKPFVVTTGSQKIQVLGTHFNVHAYQDEKQWETTLLEGKILVTKGNQIKVLEPGQQAVNVEGSPLRIINVPDAQNAIAWKNGLLSSSHESVYSVMNKISRWYDVDIEYHGNFDGKSFGGTISKFEKVEDVLSIIESTGSVHFKIKEKRIIVMP